MALDCNGAYNGFFTNCVVCALNEGVWTSVITVGRSIYPTSVPDALWIGAVTAGIWLTVVFLYKSLPQLKDAWEQEKKKLPVTVIRAFIGFGMLGLGAYAGFDLAMGVMEIVVAYGISPGLQAVVTVINSGLAPSLARIAGPTCATADTLPRIMSCMIHANEAAMGWALDAVLKQLRSLEFFNFSFWTSLYLLFRLSGPLVDAPISFIKSTFRLSATTVLIPYALALWPVPATRGAGSMLAKVAVEGAVNLLLLGVLVAACAGTAAAALAAADQHSLLGTNPIYSGDPFDCFVFRNDNGLISIAPWQPAFWILMGIAKTYVTLIEAAEDLARFVRAAVFRDESA